MNILSQVRRAAVIVWWTPTWWMTRLVVWCNPDHAWKRTPSIQYMIDAATKLFRQLNNLLWLLLIEIVIFSVLFYLK
jgi:hypothetical protein